MTRIKYFTISLCFLTILHTTSFAQANISGIINDYYPVTDIDVCNNRIVLEATPFGLAVGDRVLLIQMKGANVESDNTSTYGDIIGYGSTGTYEILTVGALSFNIVTCAEVIMRDYNTANGVVQLVRVPEYADVNIVGTLTCSPWDGAIGGVLSFIADGTVNFNADIDVTGLGFRGGNQITDPPCGVGVSPTGYDGYVAFAVEQIGGGKGESITKNGDAKYGRGAPANGGGGGNERQSGGGGGGNYALGGIGGSLMNPPIGLCGGDYPGIGGHALSYSTVARYIFMGGGGGSGSSNLGTATNGGGGGAIVLIKANTINGNGFTLKANGESVTATAADDGAGGGGGAGVVALELAAGIGTPLTVQVIGGTGGNTSNAIDGNNCVGPGGGGGGGALWMNGAALPAMITLDASAGNAGITTGEAAVSPCFNSTNGALAGAPGGYVANLAIPISAVPYVPLSIAPTPTDTIICAGDSVTLLPNALGTGNLDYAWNDPDGSIDTAITVTPQSDYTYSVVVTDGLGCQTFANFNVVVVDTVHITVDPDTTIVFGESVDLNTSLPDTYNYTWTPNYYLLPNDTTPNVTVNPDITTTYCLTVTEPLSGCSSSDCVTIAVLPEIAFPNAFSPNGDGLNDIFRIPEGTICNNVTQFQIYDRWGGLVYDYFTSSGSLGWDGTNGSGVNFPIGNYIYMIKLNCDGQDKMFAHDILLVR